MGDMETGALGVWGRPAEFAVTAERIAAYAEATNDPIPAHRRGDIAPPVFAVVPAFQSMMAVVMASVPFEAATKGLHERHELRFHRSVSPGDALVCRARPIGRLRRPHGSTLTVHAESRTLGGALVTEQWLTAVFVGYDAAETAGEQAPEHRFDPALRERPALCSTVAHLDDDQTFRYAQAAGDPLQIHLDDEVARRAGFPGIIAHGMCVMAFASWALLTGVAESRTDRIERLAVRFTRPVLPGQDLTTAIWPNGDGHFAFESTVGKATVLSDGLARFAPAV
ncbi:MaoC/PaaZ C-terminal domain-containing protein [Allonocardiopsis opalescens]|uniref:MaoC dehydratase-like protein n=1 Tax=Allonocardiopsis opalescens TaxID=1144618 RepID=A0A2T0PYF9_9ACTN|nr:MaoC/PaaZ C-terminal domain-containing protein [Allonocardiopsis opalescens]PRX96576.1 MaoC dehydratase-like protein [Allonocardiopsis opalescens]